MILPSKRRTWIWYVAVGAVPTLLFAVGPHFARVSLLFDLVGVSSVAAVLLGVRIHKPRRRAPWYFMAGGLAFFAIGDLITYNYRSLFETALPFPSIGDIAYLAVYPCLALGIVLIIRARTPVRDLGSFIDTLMFAVAAVVASWVFLIQPHWQTGASLGARLVSVAYPSLDLVLLLAVVRVTVGVGQRGPAFRLLVTSVACLLVTDSIYGLALGGIYSDGHVLDIGWGLFYLFWGAAALHPSMRGLTEPAERPHVQLTGARTVLLLGTALTVQFVSIIQLARSQPIDEPIAIAATIALFLLMAMRLTGLGLRPAWVSTSQADDLSLR